MTQRDAAGGVTNGRVEATAGAADPPARGSVADETFSAQSAEEGATVSGILRGARRGKGNFGLGEATAAQADEAGRAWVGEGAALSSDGRTLVSHDGLRQYRPPNFKPKLGRQQANLEWRGRPQGQWQGNGHIDVVP